LFIRSCNVYLELGGERAIVVHCFNHAGLTAEIPETARVCARDNTEELGRVALNALHGCVWQPEFNYRNSKRSDWPAFKASRERSIAQFERRWKLVRVRGANEHNVTWIVEVDTAFDFSLCLTASVGSAGLGEAILYMVEKFNELTQA
jgi:hypothetical protein